jgi:hypothetical protein
MLAGTACLQLTDHPPVSVHIIVLCAVPGAIKIPTQFTPDDEVGAPKTETALLFEVVDGSTWSLVSWGTSAVNK